MNAKLYLAKRLALSLGLLLVGAAMAWTLSLALLQDAAIAAGELPQPGSQIMDSAQYESNPLWKAAETLQTLANTAAVLGAVLVLAYGVADHKIQEVLE